MTTVRKAAVAGRFYPAEAGQLQSIIRKYLNDSKQFDITPKAIIAPHAGYVYSGAVAANAYAQLQPLHHVIRRVVLLGPAHHVPVRGLAACDVEAFETPLGEVPIDRTAIAQLLTLPQVEFVDDAHSREHSLEVHVPFLQEVLDDFSLIPLVIGNATADQVAEVIELLWGGPETLFVISSDLSHFHTYETAVRLDRETSQVIEQMRYQDLKGEQACGHRGIRGLLSVAEQHGLRVRTIAVRNSGDTGGGHDRVVGYGAYVLE
jgi:AmmeMemoRadiSam system protein B